MLSSHMLLHFEILTFRKISFCVLCRLYCLHCECYLLTTTRYKNKYYILLYIRNFSFRHLVEELGFYCSFECGKISHLILSSCLSLKVAHKYSNYGVCGGIKRIIIILIEKLKVRDWQKYRPSLLQSLKNGHCVIVVFGMCVFVSWWEAEQLVKIVCLGSVIIFMNFWYFLFTLYYFCIFYSH